MEELDKVKKTKETLTICGEEREIRFTFSAWAELEEKYGSIQNLEKIKDDIETRPFHTLPELVYIGLVNKEGVTKETVLNDYGMDDLQSIAEVVGRALFGSLPQSKKKAKKAE